nr:hypothetical protein [Micromonospora sp. DSM 115978]
MAAVTLATAVASLLTVAGCTPSARDDTGAAASPGASTVGPTGPAGPDPAATGSPTGSPAGEPVSRPGRPPAGRPGPDDPVTFRTAYGWGVPSKQIMINHPVRPPVAPPPAPSLPYLVEIHAADHPDERPGHGRISFYFRGGFPSYEFGYVDRVRAEGTGDTVELPGNAYLRIRFVEAQAHDERGRSTITESPDPTLGFRTLRGYGFGGDFEGYVTYGLGLRVAAGSDQALRIRVLELTRANGMHVIAFDVRHG